MSEFNLAQMRVGDTLRIETGKPPGQTEVWEMVLEDENLMIFAVMGTHAAVVQCPEYVRAIFMPPVGINGMRIRKGHHFILQFGDSRLVTSPVLSARYEGHNAEGEPFHYDVIEPNEAT